MLRNFAVLVVITLHWLIPCRKNGVRIAIVDASIVPIGDPNIAVGKISSQSSTYEVKGESSKAIDGSFASSYDNGDCTLTKQDFEPWWMVDLISAFQISAVLITNRGDCCESRIKGAEILIGDLPTKGGTMNPRCATINSMGLGETISFSCAGMQGQYVTITIPGRREFLSLCEVQVLARPWLHVVHDGGRSPVRDSGTDLGLQGRTLNFPKEPKAGFVVISPLQPLNLIEFTLCMRVTVEYLDDGKMILFSYHSQNDELRILRESKGQFGLHMGGKSVMFALPDLSTLGSHLCVSWESEFGLTAFWMNGRRSIRKVHNVGHILQPGGTTMLGQDQEAESMSEQKKCQFVGEITDLYMWDYVLKTRDIEAVFQVHQFPSGNIFDWKILSYKITGNVMVLPKDNDNREYGH
ncbi:pentraxin fusion protein-like [Tiliqua scincoides]|uniref:pentraxin fusion protein-like n=1 Tax=Tiliqua scincoides TaxID=71010 RepID=UPI0034635045